MRYLVDTHVWLWMLAAPGRIRGRATAVIEDAGSQLVLSAVSSWEIAVKYAVGKLPLPEAPDRYVPSRMRASGITGLEISHAHALRASALPRHHDDPFDRLLIAQAELEDLTIITADPTFDRYDVVVMKAA